MIKKAILKLDVKYTDYGKNLKLMKLIPEGSEIVWDYYRDFDGHAEPEVMISTPSGWIMTGLYYEEVFVGKKGKEY